MNIQAETQTKPRGKHTTTPSEREKQEQIGDKIRALRIMRGMTQQDVAKYLCVSYQQQHKYEKGINRISLPKLYELSQLFDINLADFIDPSWIPRAKQSRERLFLETARNIQTLPPEWQLFVHDTVVKIMQTLGSTVDGPG